MSYSDFDLKKVRSAFDLNIVETEDLFSQVDPVAISPLLAEILKQNVPLALAIGTAPGGMIRVCAPRRGGAGDASNLEAGGV